MLADENYFEYYHHELIQRVLNLSGLVNLMINQGMFSGTLLDQACLPENFLEKIQLVRQQIDDDHVVYGHWLHELKQETDALHIIYTLEKCIRLLIQIEKRLYDRPHEED